MRLGLALPHYDFSLPEPRPITFGAMASTAIRAEKLGFDSVWISDHFFLSLARYGGSEEPSGALEPMTSLAALAAVTSRVRLGTLVLCAPFRQPSILAKMATAADLVSGGRLDLGLGAGWYEEEFEAFGYRFGTVGERFESLEDAMGVLRALFGPDEPARYEGHRVAIREAYNHPRPAQPSGPPLWLGAKGGDRSLELAARLADGWNTVWKWTPGAYAKRAAAAARACEEVGRDPSTLRLSVGLYTLVGEDEPDLVARFRALQRWTPGGALDGELLDSYMLDTLSGTPDQVLERLHSFAELGVEEMILCAGSVPFALADPSMLDVIAEAVLPAARTL